ncbi:MAG: TIGR04283 family arsenosugar biosynthesis glycosyltransferase [Gammaproteobacteria bacterium]
MTPAPTVSLVIPVLGDRAALRELLEHIQRMPARPDQIIVVDGGDDPRCAALCARHGAVCLRTRPGRGHQLHAGAMRSAGDVVWFLHADAEPAPDAVARIRETISTGAIGGYFRFRFTGPGGWHKSLLATLINWRCRIGVPYGDQGLFVARSTYAETGGFEDVPLFEEVRFVRDARRAGRFAALATPLGVSPRRWERDGWWRRTLHNRALALGYLLGVPPARLSRRYAASRGKRPARC